MRRATVGIFTPEEIGLVDRVIDFHKGKTAADISNESHGFIGWELARDQETIPYPVALVTTRGLRQSELKHARTLIPVAEGLLKQDEPETENCTVGT